MSENNTNVPKIRFPGFTDAWEQRKLKNFGKATGGTSIESEFADNGKYKVISIGSYSEQSVYKDQNIRAQLTDKTKKRVLNKNDLTMILNDKTASGNIIGRVLLIDSNDSYVYNQRTERIEPDQEKYDSQFLYQLLNAPMIRSKIIKQAQGNTQIYVNWSAVGELDYLVPNLDEQREIGLFFKTIDHLITLHQRKLNHLQAKKKSLLQKMFPKNGADVPEIRFPGFTNAWEQRKLDDIVNFYSGLTYSPDNVVENGGTLVLRSSNVKDGEIVSADDVHVQSVAVNSDNVQVGDVIVVVRNGSRSLIGKHAQIKQPMENTVIGAFMTGVRSEIPGFTNALLDTQQFEVEIRKNLGATINQITTGAFRKMRFYVPKKDEQQKIGSFFGQLDHLITLHQRKLKHLQVQKKSLLQQMFA